MKDIKPVVGPELGQSPGREAGHSYGDIAGCLQSVWLYDSVLSPLMYSQSHCAKLFPMHVVFSLSANSNRINFFTVEDIKIIAASL